MQIIYRLTNVGQTDDAEHTLFNCPRLADQRANMAEAAGEDLSLKNIITHITQSETKWKATVKGIHEIILKKEKEERDMSKD